MNQEESQQPPSETKERNAWEHDLPGKPGKFQSRKTTPVKANTSFAGASLSTDFDPEEAAFLGRIKIDLETPLEQTFYYGMWIMVVMAYVCFHGGVFGGKHSPPSPEMLKGIPIFLGAALSFYFLRQATDNYYVLDVRGRRVLYHFRLLSWETMKPAFALTDILTLAMVSVTRQSKHSSWEEYRLQVIKNNGEIVQFSDWDKDRYVIHTRGERLEKLIGCPLEVGGVDEKIVVGWHPTGDPYICWEPAGETTNRILLWVLGGIICTVVIVVLIALL